MAVTGRIRDIGPNVLQSVFKQEVVTAPVISKISPLSHSSRKPNQFHVLTNQLHVFVRVI
jgi:hypothetical protein